MGSSGMRILVTGTKDVEAALTRVSRQIDAASIAALKACQSVTKSSIKAGLRGRPRWDHRGKSARTGATVRLNLTPHQVSKAGGPGKLTGTLARGVGGVRKPKADPLIGTVQGGVGVGGGVRNLYKKRLESQYPYVAPGVAKATPKMGPIWAKAWQRATAKWD
ncbi:hypothetical protein [Kitasatospora sp. NBC_01266]|uniref:hypothetical protein n=1 Tax=Kitasatospora sp. NBC_01266 TaxID=2903572 RepID=UPI002E2F0552|nr:hypothetical protein [Kitasatospora sp. NBC_01266]